MIRPFRARLAAAVAAACLAPLGTAVSAHAADLSLFQSASPATVAAGGTVTFTLTVTNVDAGAVTGVTLTDTLPAGAEFVSATPSPAGTCEGPAGGELTCFLGTLDEGGSATVEVVVTAPAVSGTITNEATVVPTDVNPLDNTSSRSVKVAAAGPVDVAVDGTASPTAVIAGDQVTYEFITSSPADAANLATGVEFTATLPAGLTLDSATSSAAAGCTGTTTVTCPLGDILPGDVGTVTLTATTSAGIALTGGQFTVTGSATVGSGDPDPSNNSPGVPVTLGVPGATDLAVTAAGPAAILRGREARYAFTVANTGAAAATGAQLTLAVPASATVTATGVDASCVGTGPIVCDLTPMLSGDTRTVDVAVTSGAGTASPFTVTGTASHDNADPDAGDDTAGVTTTLQEATAFAAALVRDPSLVTGAQFTAIPPLNDPAAVMTAPLAGFPVHGPGYALLTTGSAALAGQANTTGNAGLQDGGVAPPGRGDTAFDVTTLRVDLAVPAGADCLQLDFRFLSEEYPEFVGSQYNDAFIAELDTSTWTTNGSVIAAPGNFAFDEDGNEISVNATGVASVSAAEAAGTTYDSATRLLRASTPVTPGAHSLYLSILDQGDARYDSAVMLDNLLVGAAGPAGCVAGVAAAPLAMTKTADTATVTAGADTGYTITITNPNAAAATVTSVADELPAGFAYTPGSTSGLTTANPVVTGSPATGQTLTWTGAFPVPGGEEVTLHFGVTAGPAPGTFTNSVTAQAADGATVAPTGPTAPVTVEPPPAGFSITDASVLEGTGGSPTLTFTISRGAGPAATVQWATAPGSATSPADFDAAAGTATFAPGATQRDVQVTVVGDALDEPTETFTVVLSNPSLGAVDDATGVGTIFDDDAPPGLSVGDVTVVEGATGTVNAVFTVSLASDSGRTVTADVATQDGTAVAPGDYTTTARSLTFLPGETSKTVAVPVRGDVLDEADETFKLTASAVVNAVVADGEGTGTITDDDAPPQATVGDAAVTEGTGGSTTAAFTVALSAPSGRVVTVGYGTADGSATAPADYAATSGQVTFAPGDTTAAVQVPVVPDALDEPDEAFTLTLTAPVNATLGDAQATGAITDDDLAPGLTVGDVTVAEGDSGTSPAEFTVTLSAPSGRQVSAVATTADGTAVAPGDYAATSVPVVIPPGATAATVQVPVAGDVLTEADETFLLQVGDVVNAVPADAEAVGTITDDDAPRTVAVGDVTVAEGDSGTVNAVFPVTLSGPSGGTVTVDFQTADGTATSPLDFAATNGTVTFAPGETQATATVPVTGDTVDEPDETFAVALANPSGATVADGDATGTITDDDAAPSVAVADASVTEGDAGTATAAFTVTLSARSARTVTVAFGTADGTATAPADYAAASGTLTFPPGQTRLTVPVAVAGDTLGEPDETFTLGLSGAVNATLGDASATGLIVNDDPLIDAPRPLVIRKSAGRARVPVNARNGYEVTIVNPNGRPLTVTRVVDCLPSRFAYVRGSTFGALRADPSVATCGRASRSGPAPRELTWTGRVTVPARGSVSFTFEVKVGSRPGTFRNAVTAATAEGFAVTPTGPTAPVRVVKPPKRGR